MKAVRVSKVCRGNFFEGLPGATTKELFRTIGRGRGFKIERIVSRGQATPEGKWLCSKRAEWVIVLRGRARLLFEGVRGALEMKAGDHVFIPAHTRHRVDWTSPRQRTVWLAVHDKH